MADYTFFDPATGELTPSPRSGTPQIDLTTALELTEMRGRLWSLDPGDAVGLHRQTVQEELFIQLSGPGRMRLGDEYRDVPEGAMVRVPPETPRQVINDTDEGPHVWVVLAAPPVEGDGRPIDSA